MEAYNLEYHKQLDRSHILPNLINGARQGVISQFIADIVISLLSYNEAIVINDIKISEIASYYAAVVAGMTVGFLSIYMDTFAVVIFSTVAYQVTYDLVEERTVNEGYEITAKDIIEDSIFIIIMIYIFDPTARKRYLRYRQKAHFIEPTIPREDRGVFLIVFFIVISSTYNFLKSNKNTKKEANTCL